MLLSEARVVIAKDMLLRHWVSQVGGVYVPAGPLTEPNPLLKGMSERDIATPSGRRLTFFDASYTLRKVGELGRSQGLEGVSRLTSLDPLMRRNAPDPWEAQALKALEAGAPEASVMELVSGRRRLRLMKPLRVEESCLACHSPVQYKKGDLLGGISVSLPADQIDGQSRAHLMFEAAAHGLLWLIGLAGIGFGFWRMALSEESRRSSDAAALKNIELHRNKLEAEVLSRTRDLAESNERLGKESESRLRTARSAEAVNRLLAVSLSEETLEAMLQACLVEILSIPWLSIQAKGVVFLADRDSRILRMAAEKGLGKAVKSACASVPFGRCHCGKAASTGEIQYAASLDERHETRYEGIAAHGHYTVPIMSSGEVLGVLAIYLNEGHPWHDGEAGFLKAAADVLAGIIRHKTEERKSRMLAEVASIVSLAESTQDALSSILGNICSCMGWPCGDAWLPLEDGSELHYVAAWTDGVPAVAEFAAESVKYSFKPGEGLPGRVFYRKAPLIIDDVTADPDFPRAGLAGNTGVRSAMGIPVMAGKEAVAVLAFYSTARAFHQEEADFAALVAAHTAPLILRKRAEDRLRLSQEALAEAQRIGGTGSWDCDLATRRVAWSDELYRIMGVPLGKSVSLADFLASVPPEEKEAVQKSHVEALEQGRGFDKVRRALRPDGSVIWVRDIGAVIRAEDGKPLKFAGTVQDITASKSLEEQLGQAQKMEAVGRLAGGVAHDFNNLLTAIQGYSDFLLASLKPEDPQRADVEEIRQAGQRAAALTRQLLAFSRKQPVSPKEVDLNPLVSNLKKMLARLLGETIEIALDLDPSLPLVLVDPGQLEQAVMNLSVNARDAMPKGGRIEISTRVAEASPRCAGCDTVPASGRCVLLAVRDTGSGMDQAVLSRIFEPFFTTKPKDKGTGLGLSIVYSAVKQAGGDVRVESAPGQGTTFTICLPALAEGRVETKPEALPAPTGSETVLLVEDEQAVRKTASRMLASCGYRVLEASGPDEALSLAKERGGEIRLVLTDVAMPGRSGLELASELAALGLKSRTLFMTGYSDPDNPAFKELDRGLAVLRKPFTREELARKVREILDS